MKGKKSTQAVMLAAVLAIWGVIFYKIYDKLSGDDEAAPPLVLPGDQLPRAHAVDTFMLLANYSDPFAHESLRETHHEENAAATTAAKPLVKSTAKPAVAAADPQVRYLGMIRNNTSKKKVALVMIGGASSMLQEKQSSGKVRLLRILNDSLEVTIDGKKRFIRKG